MRCTLPGLVILDTNILFNTFRIFSYTPSSSFFGSFGLWIVVFFSSLNSRVIPPSNKFWSVWRILEFCSKVLIFQGFRWFLKRKLRILVISLFWRWWLTVGEKESYDFYCWRPAAQNGGALVLFKAMTKYGKPYAKEHQIWWSVKKRQKLN